MPGLSPPKKPKILFFLPALVAGGAEIHAIVLCEKMIEAGFDCTIVAHGTNCSEALMDRDVARRAIRLNLRGMSELSGWLEIWRLLRRIKPDLIVAINQTPFIISFIEKAMLGTRAALACIFHSTEMQPFERYLEGPFRVCARFADLLVYVSESQRNIWEGRGLTARRIRVIPNGVDLERFQPSERKRSEVRAELGLGEDVFLIGIVAAFRREKNHADLIRALARARALGSRAMVLAVGEGATQNEAKALARDLGLTDRMIFLGVSADIDRLVNACDTGVLCSTAESFPLAAIEFLAAGVPMLVSAISGNLELVKPDFNGLVHRPGDIEQFAANIMAMEDSATRARLARNARPSVERFSTASMAADYEQEFKKLCTRKHA
jgi:glycosyltransferase involved in cell wall biosynthesis